MLSVSFIIVTLNVIILSVAMLNVVAPAGEVLEVVWAEFSTLI